MTVRFHLSWLFIAIAMIAGFLGFSRWYRAHKYPYGWSHACDKGMYLELTSYADTHNGSFPRGEATPEASLSLLSSDDPSMAYLLAGKSAPVVEAEKLLAAGKKLTPQTCSWHYVEGLHTNDNPKLALFWDKIGLGHNGERMPEGGHNVWFIGGEHRWVSAEEWPQFLEEQDELLPKRPGLTPAAFRQGPGH